MTAVYLAVHLEMVHNKMCLITSHKTVANIYRHKDLTASSLARPSLDNREIQIGGLNRLLHCKLTDLMIIVSVITPW